ncbi:carbohydrate ABC transporter permease [Rhodopila sp.]|uniref:carbohydrate ABC transporter permease n=1 Tax=Rhodopila sp. TaxID=2480087 RepID=UPI003D0A29B4
MTGARRRPRASHARRRLRHGATIAAFIGPFLLLLAVFQYLPVARMMRDSLYSYQLLNPDERLFVGLENYVELFTDPDTLRSFSVTFGFAAGTIVVVIPLSFLLAVYLNGRLPMRAVVRTVVFLPVVTSAVVIATMWTFLLDPANGLINGALAGLDLPRLAFLTSKAQALPSVVLVTVWQQLGFATILFLSGLQGIPAELEDAARVDGASGLQRLRHVVLPLLGRTTLFVVVIMTVFALQSFAPPLIMTGGGPEGTTNFVVYNIYQTAFSLQQPGMASAISTVFMFIVLGISLVQMGLLRTKWNY